MRVEDPGLTAELEAAKIPFKGEVTNNWLPTILSWVVPVALFFLLWSYIGKKIGSAGSGSMQIGKSKAKVYIEKATGVTFADVAGIDEAEEEVAEIVGFLKDPEKYQRLGGRIPKGVLIVGPPGTGKHCWLGQSPVRPAFPSSAFPVPTSSKCLSESGRLGSGICSFKQ